MKRAAAILLCALAALAAHAGIQQMMLGKGSPAPLLNTFGVADDCGGTVGWALVCGSIGSSTVTGVGSLNAIGFNGANSALAITAAGDPGQSAIGDVEVTVGGFGPVTCSPGDASYAWDGSQATWTWAGGCFGFLDDTGFTLSIYAP